MTTSPASENFKEPEEVEKLSFITYVFDGKQIKLYKNKAGEKFICTLYKCKRLDGSIEVLPFRQPYEPETIFAIERDVGWNFTNYEDTSFELDVIPDTITCSRDEVEAFENEGIKLPRPGRISKELAACINKDKQKKFVLEKILKEDTFKMYHSMARARLIYLETPTLETLRNFQELKEEHPNMNNQLNELIKSMTYEE